MKILSRLLSYSIFTFGFSSLAIAQTAVVTYGAAVAVPVLGSGGLLALSFVLILLGTYWLKNKPHASRSLAMAAIITGLLTSVGSAGWLVNNAEAVAETTEYLFSEHPSPVSVTSFPAVLTNDLVTTATITALDISECPGEISVTGSCEANFELAANGGSCTLDSICAPFDPGVPQVCDTGTDTHTSAPYVVCEANANDAWISADTGGQYNADLICQEQGYDRADAYGGTCGNVCGYCEETTSCESPGNKNFDGGGLGAPGPFGKVLRTTVQWTCVNDPV